MTDRYELDCTDCPFQMTVAGAFADAVEVIEEHRIEQEATSTTHFVNVHRLS